MVTKVQGLWKTETTGEVIWMTPNQDQSPRSVDSRDYTWSDYNNLNHDESPKSVESRDCEVISTMPDRDQSSKSVESRDWMWSYHQHNAISWPARSWPKFKVCAKQRLYVKLSPAQCHIMTSQIVTKVQSLWKAETVCEIIASTMPYHDQSLGTVKSRDYRWSDQQNARWWPKSRDCRKQRLYVK